MAENVSGNTLEKVTGGCFCGDVSFSAELPSKWCAHCHCTMCRRIHGAGYVTWVGFDSNQLTFDSGQALQWYKSSPEARRGSCSTCGSNLFFESRQWEGETHVTLASFNETIDRSPQAHAYYQTHVDWMPADESLTKVK
jgi:hypothetical protein